MPYNMQQLDSDMIRSPFAFPPDNPPPMPRQAPEGQKFYLVTHPNPAEKARKFFFQSKPGRHEFDKPTLLFVHTRNRAMVFDNLHLAESWAEFVCRNHRETDVFIVLE